MWQSAAATGQRRPDAGSTPSWCKVACVIAQCVLQCWPTRAEHAAAAGGGQAANGEIVRLWVRPATAAFPAVDRHEVLHPTISARMLYGNPVLVRFIHRTQRQACAAHPRLGAALFPQQQARWWLPLAAPPC